MLYVFTGDVVRPAQALVEADSPEEAAEKLNDNQFSEIINEDRHLSLAFFQPSGDEPEVWGGR